MLINSPEALAPGGNFLSHNSAKFLRCPLAVLQVLAQMTSLSCVLTDTVESTLYMRQTVNRKAFDSANIHYGMTFETVDT